MHASISEPRVAEEGVYFRVEAEGGERECLISKNALAYMCRVRGQTVDFMEAYRTSEEQIVATARRLVAAGERATPLVLGAAYFVGAPRR